MAKMYPLWFSMPTSAAKAFCEDRDGFLAELARVLHLFHDDDDAWKRWAGELKREEERSLLMHARYFARGELQRVPEYGREPLAQNCEALAMSYIKVELPRDLIPLVREAGMRIEGQIYHALGMDDDHDDPQESHHKTPKRFPTEKLPNVFRFFFYMYMKKKLP